MKHLIQGQHLIINSDKKLDFPSDIAESIDFENVLIIRLKVNRDLKIKGNVFAISQTGKILWQIREAKSYKLYDAFTKISKKGNLLVAYNSNGILYSLDPNTGKILKEDFVK